MWHEERKEYFTHFIYYWKFNFTFKIPPNSVSSVDIWIEQQNAEAMKSTKEESSLRLTNSFSLSRTVPTVHLLSLVTLKESAHHGLKQYFWVFRRRMIHSVKRAKFPTIPLKDSHYLIINQKKNVAMYPIQLISVTQFTLFPWAKRTKHLESKCK